MEFKTPIDQKAEIAVIGAMLNNKDCLDEVLSSVEADFFYDDLTKKAFTKIAELAETARVNANLLSKHMESSKEREFIRVAEMSWVDRDDFKHNLNDLTNTFLKRQYYYITGKALNLTQEKGVKADEIAGLIEDGISSIYFEDKSENIIDPKIAGEEEHARFIHGLTNPEDNYGIRFSTTINDNVIGIPSLDEVLFGAQGGDLLMFAAKTGVGKTALALNMARVFSVFQNHTGYYQNAEMQKKEMIARIVAPIARVTVKEIMSSQLEGTYDERIAKVNRIERAYQMYTDSNLFISRIPQLTLQKSKGLARMFRNRYKKLDYLIVDYIGRMELENAQGLSEWQMLYQIAKKLKEMAVEMDIPIIILSQVNEEGFIEGAKKIKNECDGVFFFKPIEEKDQEYIDQTYLNPEKRKRVTHKLTKEKVRRDDNPFPIYCEFKKKLQYINEVTTS